jgi:predicted DsbA family dithiol-disulfide isomerase
MGTALVVGARPLALALAFGAVRLAQPAPPGRIRVGLAANDGSIPHFESEDSAEALAVSRAYAESRAHEAAHWARSQGRFDDYHEAVFRAFFERGEDIGDLDVLASLAAGLGLDGDALRRSLEAGEFTASVLADEQESQALGLGGVPAFVADRRAAVTGVQTVTMLARLVEHVRPAADSIDQ